MTEKMKVARGKLIVIIGPTASGKSDLAVSTAKKYNGEVISADSRQVYRGLDIGTGKITKKEMRGIPHHLLDVADPKRQFSVVRYRTLADKAIRNILRRGKVPILCGGTAFYIDAVVNDILLPDVKPNKALRRTLEKKDVEELFSLLKKLDPNRAQDIDKENPRRLIRAIEIATALGKVPRLTDQKPRFDTLKIGISPPKEVLHERIGKRLTKRMKHGMLAEVRRLREGRLSFKRMEELGLEYRHLAQLLQKKVDRARMLVELETAIRQYAKRQMTWWKRDKSIVWFEKNDLTETMHNNISSFLAKK